MNQNALRLPIGITAGHTAVAALAAVGAVSMLPAPVRDHLPGAAVPLLTVLIAAGLILAGRRLTERGRAEAATGAASDPATGLASPATAERVLALEFAAAQRGRPLAVVLIRLNEFPLYASRHGKAASRQLLRAVGRTLRKHRRGMHLTAHWGRDQGTYLSILSGMDVEGAAVYTSRVRREIMTLRGLPLAPSVSAGIAAFDMSMRSPDELIERARKALDRGYEAGGKVVVLGQMAG